MKYNCFFHDFVDWKLIELFIDNYKSLLFELNCEKEVIRVWNNYLAKTVLQVRFYKQSNNDYDLYICEVRNV